MGKKLVVSDLDGTLLDQEDRLSPQYVTELNSLINRGLAFTIATGRDLKKTKKAVPDLILKYPVILTNGSLLINLNAEKYYQVYIIEHEIVLQIMAHAKQIGIPPMVYAFYENQIDKVTWNKGKWGKVHGIHHLTPDQYEPFYDSDTVSIQFHNKKEILDPFRDWIWREFGEKINLIYIEDVGYKNATGEVDWYWLEINSEYAGKDKMLRKLAEVAHFDLTDVVVFGDNSNDVDMLRIAGLGIAVENAKPEVKDVAKKICGSNLTGGVIRYLKEHLSELL